MKLGVATLSLVHVSLVAIGLIFSGPSLAEIDPESILGAWLFDENKGETVGDSHGDLVGTFAGGKGLKWVEGKFGSALEFNGADYVDLGKDPDLEADATKTVTVWVKTADKKDQVVVGNEQSGWNGWWVQLGFGGGHGRIGFLSQSQVDQSTGEVEVDEWSHVAVVADHDKGKILYYIDGELDSTVNRAIRITASQRNLWIGGEEHARRFLGVIDDLAVFNVVLSEDDIKTIVNKGISGMSSAVLPKDKLPTVWAGIKN